MRAIHDDLEGGTVRRRERNRIDMAVDHGFHDLHFGRDVGLVRRTIPNNLYVMLPGALDGSGMYALPKNVGAGLRNHRNGGDVLPITAYGA